MALTRYFERGGWVVRQAEDGAEALEPVRDFLQRTTRPVLEKPFELGALAEMVERVSGRR